MAEKCVWCPAPAVRVRDEERGPWGFASIPECAEHEGGPTSKESK